jgi:phosphoribosylamine--glycine ligase
MKTIVAVIDAGGRGAALVDAYAKSPLVDEIIAIPGNDLMKFVTSKPVHTYPDLKTTSKDEILKICQEFQVSFIDVAQDNAVEAGVSDLLRENGFKVFGASKAAGQLEWDKAWSRDFMVKNDLPVPAYQVCSSEEEGLKFLQSQKDQAWFIKAAGLAEGKGVIPARDNAQAIEAIKEMSRFGNAGATYLIEQALVGEEFSAFAIADSGGWQYLGAAQDHKRVDDGDLGPNTGGMGCATPPLVVDQNIRAQIDEIFNKTFAGLKKEELEYQGVLYLGGIVVSEEGQEKVYIIEYNARWGDPEVECILPGIENDWYQIGLAVSDNRLSQIKITNDGRTRIAVAGASLGYPEDYSKVKGREILGLSEFIKSEDLKIYGAGVKIKDGKYIASGGRLFYVVASGKDTREARDKAYKALETISIPGENQENLLHFRKDIGYRDVDRLSQKV